MNRKDLTEEDKKQLKRISPTIFQVVYLVIT